MLSRLENGCIHAQAPRIAEPSTVDNRSTEFDVTTSLRRNTVCTSVIVGYGVKMKRRLSAMCELLLFSPKLTKTSSIRDRLLLSSKRSSLSLYRLRDVWALTEKQMVSTSLGVFRHEGARTDLPRKNLNEKTSAYMIVRELGERGSSSSSEQSRVLACAILFFWIFLSKLVRSWCRLICREMTCISRHENSLDLDMVMLTRKQRLVILMLDLMSSSFFFFAVRAQTTVTRHTLRPSFEANLCPI